MLSFFALQNVGELGRQYDSRRPSHIPPSLVLSVPIIMERTSLELMEYIANLLFRLRQLLEQRPDFSVEGPSTKKGLSVFHMCA